MNHLNVSPLLTGHRHLPLTIPSLQNEHPAGTGWQEDGTCAMCLPWMSLRAGGRGWLLCFPARFLFSGRRERLISAMGKAAAFGHLWKAAALALSLIRPAVALRVRGRVRGDPGR